MKRAALIVSVSNGAAVYIDWDAIVRPDRVDTEVILRGSIMYLGMLALLRVFAAGGCSRVADLGDRCDRRRRTERMAGESRSVTEAIVLVSVLFLGMATRLDGFKSKFAAEILEPSR